MRKSHIKKISLAVFLAFMSFVANSAELGHLNIHSALGEPLKADIELLSVSPQELSTLVAAIASEEAYAAQGLTRLAIFNNIKAEVTKKSDGLTLVTLSSVQPISDPYLGLLVQIDWATGRLQREYTVLLDPPEYKSTADDTALLPISPLAGNAVDAVKKITNNPSDALVSNQVKHKISPDVASLIKSDKKPINSAKEISLVTERGDTLEAVARDMQIDGVSLNQMLLGLYEHNISAFSGANINRLKVGQIIKLPTKEILTSIDEQQAKQSIKVHATNWNAYRNSLAKNVQKTDVAIEPEHKQFASGRIASAEDKASSIKPILQDVVKLSAGDQALNGKSQEKMADAKAAALQDEAVASKKSLQDAQDRTHALEKQIIDMQKLLVLKSKTIVELQKKVEPAITIKKPASIQSVPNAKLGFIANLINSTNFLLLSLALAVVFLGAIWMYFRHRSKQDIDRFERGILSPSELNPNTTFTDSNSNDVDPIAEAEVYAAYGRSAQAEEILKEAISKEPTRYELHLKLLELYAKRKDSSAFEAIAAKLYIALGAADPIWAKIAAIGANLSPENPLYEIINVAHVRPLVEQLSAEHNNKIASTALENSSVVESIASSAHITTNNLEESGKSVGDSSIGSVEGLSTTTITQRVDAVPSKNGLKVTTNKNDVPPPAVLMYLKFLLYSCMFQIIPPILKN